MNIMKFFSTLGKSTQLPIAVLPLAGILVGVGLFILGFGDHNSQGLIVVGTFLQNSGLAVFDNLPLVFALGLSIGFAKDHHGAAVLAAFIGHIVLLAGIKVLEPITSPDLPIKLGVFSGILIGPIAGTVYNRFNNVKLHSSLAFFAGKRAVPIMMGLVAMCLALALSIVWPSVQKAIDYFGYLMTEAGPAGKFTFGFFNRMLLPVGLHNVLNTIFWFDLGSFTNAAGEVVRGDLARYWSGDSTAGGYMVGFFPIMMFGLPGACLAMILSAKAERRNAIAGMFISMAFTSFVTGITEPIEFSFMFLAFPLYIIHALLAGLSLAFCEIFGARLGFNFSAGVIDMILSWKLGSNQGFVLMLGVFYFVLYFMLFWLAIKMFNLKTPGREDVDPSEEENVVVSHHAEVSSEKITKIIDGLGGASNISYLDACATRLRVEVKSNEAVSDTLLKSAGAKGVMSGKGTVQVIIGTEANDVADALNAVLKKQ